MGNASPKGPEIGSISSFGDSQDCPGVLDLLDSGCSDGGRACMVRGFSLKYYGVYYQKFLQDQSLPSFQQLGSLPCQSICLWSSGSNQWTSLGNGLRGVANQVELLGSNLEEPVGVGRFQLNLTVGDVSIAHWGFDDQLKSWVGIGNQSTIPRPVRLVTVGGKGDLEVDGFLLVEI
ncbi:hypothetical protein BY996DRAFT_6421423 [Phakopsora pachyrhizi]|nr:hypothetical protein BY996DRAFT_6421423 [Phakopsora pachyrhizi]